MLSFGRLRCPSLKPSKARLDTLLDIYVPQRNQNWRDRNISRKANLLIAMIDKAQQKRRLCKDHKNYRIRKETAHKEQNHRERAETRQPQLYWISRYWLVQILSYTVISRPVLPRKPTCCLSSSWLLLLLLGDSSISVIVFPSPSFWRVLFLRVFLSFSASLFLAS